MKELNNLSDDELISLYHKKQDEVNINDTNQYVKKIQINSVN